MDSQLFNRVNVNNKPSQTLELSDTFIEKMYHFIEKPPTNDKIIKASKAFDDGFLTLLEESQKEKMSS